MLVLLDTGILLRLVNRADALHQEVRTAVRALRARGDTLAATSQNLAEFWNVCTRPASARGGLGMSVEDAAKKLRLVERLTQFVPDTSAAFPIWKQFVVAYGVSGVQVHDARLAALMTAQGITHLLTLNAADFKRYKGIVAITPREVILASGKSESIHFPVFLPVRNDSEFPLVKVNEEMFDCLPIFTSRELAELYVSEEPTGMGLFPIHDQKSLSNFIERMRHQHGVQKYAINFTLNATSVKCGPLSALVD